jgi:hypothetical protein
MTKTVIERLAAIDRQLERLRVAPTGSGSTPGGPVPDTRNMIAGAGLTGGGTLAADRTFTVGAGAGITVNADDVALTTPGTLTMASTNTATGNHTHAVASSHDPGQAAALLATGTNGQLILYNGFFTQGAQSEAVFASGFAGSGWRADYGITTDSRASIETDDLTVRGRMRVYELLIQQIRATNGSVFVSSASKVAVVTANTNPLWFVDGFQLTFNGVNANFSASFYTITTSIPPDPENGVEGDTGRELYHGFLVGDLIRAQQVEWDGLNFVGVMQSNLEVISVVDLFTYNAVLHSGDAPEVGFDYVRLGNTVDTSRQGSIYLTSDDSAAPFIDIVDGVADFSDWNSADVHRVRVGKLSGISDADFGGALGGYGLYGNNVYLKGQIVVVGGDLGGLAAADVNSNTTTIDGGKITANSVTAFQMAAHTITANEIAAGTITANEIATGTITTSELNFVPVTTSNVVASLNATAEGIRINGNRIQVNGDVTFAAGYNPTGKIPTGGAEADITTISGGKITTGTITGDKISLTSYLAINSATFGTSGIQLDYNAGNPRAYIGNGTDRYLQFTSSGGLEVKGALIAQSGGISGNFYIGSDVGASGNLYVGTNAEVRMNSTGIRMLMQGLGSSPTISTSAAALRWFPDPSAAHDDSKDYSGIIGYRHTGLAVVDNIWTSFVGSTNHTSYAARVMLQAGNIDAAVGGTYRSVELHLIKDAGANNVGSVYINAPYANIDGMLGLYPKAASSLLTGVCHVYLSPARNFVIAYFNGTTTKFRYFDLTNTSAPVWTYSTTAPA